LTMMTMTMIMMMIICVDVKRENSG
jgi:hypothetical protein